MSEHVMAAPPRGVNRWLLAARIPTLPAAAVPVVVGTAVGAGLSTFAPGPFLGALAAALLIQIGTNFANDYSDHARGADTVERLGPTRATSSGLIAPEAMKRASILTFALAAVIGLYLIYVGGWPILIIGVLSILFGLAYTGGPFPLAYNGLGDIFVFIFFGLVAVTGSAYLQTGAFNGVAVAAAVPIGLLITAILVVNNLRDIETDERAGKQTLAVLIGEQATRGQYCGFLVTAYIFSLGFWLVDAAGPWVMLSWLALPLGIGLMRQVAGGLTGRPLNGVLKLTGVHLLLFGIPFAIGFLL
jgi:1,4-dihydroxy-2-naphthoate polyprenyltransferase